MPRCQRLPPDPAGGRPARTIAEVQALFRVSHAWRIPLVFRAAGTSLSGQAITDGILADVSRHWRVIGKLDHGHAFALNRAPSAAQSAGCSCAPRRLGPDPHRSTPACSAYSPTTRAACVAASPERLHTLDSMTFVLPSEPSSSAAPMPAEYSRAGQAIAKAYAIRKAIDEARCSGSDRRSRTKIRPLLAERVRRLRSAARHPPAPAGRLEGTWFLRPRCCAPCPIFP
jgi:hypothetical protein